jgi:thiopeptide-type bacteriocin biosynthesis protein
VSAAIEHARGPIGYRELHATLLTRFPSATAETVDGLLADLVEKQFLLTDLRPSPAHADPAGHVAGLAGDTDVGRRLRQARERIDSYRKAPVGTGTAQFRSAVDALSPRSHDTQPPLRVDVRFDLDFQLPWTVAREIERTAGALYRMAREDPRAHIIEYHADFLERYGTDQTVPILELLDPNLGMDAPSGYQVPQSSRTLKYSYPTRQGHKRADVVTQLAWTAARDGGELVLDEEAVNRIGGGSNRPLPTAVELCVQLFARSADAMSRGDFLLALPPLGGFTRPGAMIGRFARLLGAEQTLSDLVADDLGGVPVQVYSHPATARSANVCGVSRLVPDTLPVGVFADLADRSVIDLADVAVGAVPDRLYLVHRRTGQALHPIVPHMLNAAYELPNAVRLLIDIEHMRSPVIKSWDWGALQSMPSLPRVRHGRTILAPACWRVDEDLATSKENWPRWRDRLAAWRERRQVPATVETTITDQRVELDLDVDLHRQLLCRELRRHPDIVLSESLLTPRSGLDWLDGHAAEFVVQLNRTPDAPARRPPVHHAPARTSTRYEPGGEWLYAAEPTHESLLTSELPDLLTALPDGVDRWFFIRYRDPEAHLRLRFHGDPGTLNTDLLPLLRDWAARARDRRTIRRLALDTYEPEINRYGGPGLSTAAEELFCADSAAVIGQLQQHTGELRRLPVQLLAAMNFVDLLRSLGDWDWTDWVAREIPRGPLDGVDRKLRSFVDPEGSWDRLTDMPGGRELMSCWARRAEAAAGFGRRLFAARDTIGEAGPILRSVLHMHANRLMGVHKTNEFQALAIVRDQVHSFRTRTGGAS